jgi:hypothetical protein
MSWLESTANFIPYLLAATFKQNENVTVATAPCFITQNLYIALPKWVIFTGQ